MLHSFCDWILAWLIASWMWFLSKKAEFKTCSIGHSSLKFCLPEQKSDCPGLSERGFVTPCLFPQNERRVAKISCPSYNQIHVVQIASFKMVYYKSGLLLSKPIISVRNSFVFCWFLKWSVSHISFISLLTCRSFNENRSDVTFYVLYFKVILSWFWDSTWSFRCVWSVHPHSHSGTW